MQAQPNWWCLPHVVADCGPPHTEMFVISLILEVYCYCIQNIQIIQNHCWNWGTGYRKNGTVNYFFYDRSLAGKACETCWRKVPIARKAERRTPHRLYEQRFEGYSNSILHQSRVDNTVVVFFNSILS